MNRSMNIILRIWHNFIYLCDISTRLCMCRHCFSYEASEARTLKFAVVINLVQRIVTNQWHWLLTLGLTVNRLSCQVTILRNYCSIAIVLLLKTKAVVFIDNRISFFQAFGEIAFCAVTASDQVQGYGSRLMSHTKVNFFFSLFLFCNCYFSPCQARQSATSWSCYDSLL